MASKSQPANKPLSGKTILITGAARRIGRSLALTAAHAGANIIIHHGHSPKLAAETQTEIQALGQNAHIIAVDLGDPNHAAELFYRANAYGPIHAVVNNAAIFEPVGFMETSLDEWQRHLQTNLTSPFLISQAFARELPEGEHGRIVNILDWRALRPGSDHFPYTISKAALAAMTQSMAIALAPRIQVNGLALGAILPPSDQKVSTGLPKDVPAARWASLQEVGQALLFLIERSRVHHR